MILFNFAFMNSYFDGSEYGPDSIKYYLNDEYYWFLDSGKM
jgi:hypothetical protein